MPVASITANAQTLPRVLLVDADSERHVKRFQTRALEIVVQMLNALFVTYRGILVRRAGPGLGRVFTTITVYLIKVFGLSVIRLQLVVTDGPCGRDAAVMPDL